MRKFTVNSILLTLFIACIILMPDNAMGQNPETNMDDNASAQIVGDTIRVAPKKAAQLRFIGQVRFASTMGSEEYSPTPINNTVEIMCKTSNPKETICPLSVDEGDESSSRNHQFVIQFVRSLRPDEQTHDYSSIRKIQARMAELERMKKGTLPTPDKPASIQKIAGEPSNAPSPTVQTGEIMKLKGNETIKDNTTDEVIRSLNPEDLKARVDVTIKAFYAACNRLTKRIDIPGTKIYAMKLFNNKKDVIVQKTHSRIPESPIEDYLQELTQMRYPRVEMTAAKINFISGKLRKAGDGTYRGTAVILQDFKGFKDNVLVYKDQAKKTMEIIVEVKEVLGEDGEVKELLQVFLGNISVSNDN